MARKRAKREQRKWKKGRKWPFAPRHVALSNLLRRAERQRRRELENDKKYREMDKGLRENLRRLEKKHSGKIRQFFGKFGFFVPAKLKDCRAFLARVQDRQLRGFFMYYLDFAARFGVTWKPPRIGRQVLVEIQGGRKFSARIHNGRLVPTRPFSAGDDIFQIFEDSILDKNTLKVAPKLKAEISEGRGAYVEIKDEDASSILTQLETIAYVEAGIGYILHHAERPYLICLIGEKLNSPAWQKVGKVITEFQKRVFERVRSGRPLDIARFEEAMEKRRRSKPLKQAALEEGKGTFESQKVYLARAAQRARSTPSFLKNLAERKFPG